MGEITQKQSIHFVLHLWVTQGLQEIHKPVTELAGFPKLSLLWFVGPQQIFPSLN